MGACASCCSCLTGRHRKNGLYDPLPHDVGGRSAIQDVLVYIKSKSPADSLSPSLVNSPGAFYDGPPLEALALLANSDNIECQRLAALAFAEISEKEPKPAGQAVFELLHDLLVNDDVEVQRAASAALGNLAVVAENRPVIVEMGFLDLMIALNASDINEVQCNAVGCITNLATDEDTKEAIATPELLSSLIQAAKQTIDVRVQRNATGALLNLTHTLQHRLQLVQSGVIPVLASFLNSSDSDVLFYATTAISNIAVDEFSRAIMSDTQAFPSLVPALVSHLSPPTPLRLQTQSALALRNLASSPIFQQLITHSPALAVLVSHLSSEYPPLLLASVACFRNLSICEDISVRLSNIVTTSMTALADALLNLVTYNGDITSSLVHQLLQTDGTVITYELVDEVQYHAVSSLRNLVASSDSNKHAVLATGFVRVMRDLISRDLKMRTDYSLDSHQVNGSKPDVMTIWQQTGIKPLSDIVVGELCAVLAVIATNTECKQKLLHGHGHNTAIIQILMSILTSTLTGGTNDTLLDLQGNALAALANLASQAHDYTVFYPFFGDKNITIMDILTRFLQVNDTTYCQLALHCLAQFLEGNDSTIGKAIAAHGGLKQILATLLVRPSRVQIPPLESTDIAPKRRHTVSMAPPTKQPARAQSAASSDKSEGSNFVVKEFEIHDASLPDSGEDISAIPDSIHSLTYDGSGERAGSDASGPPMPTSQTHATRRRMSTASFSAGYDDFTVQRIEHSYEDVQATEIRKLIRNIAEMMGLI